MNKRLKELRKALRLSQDLFGNKLGITGGAISKLEKGERNVTEQMVLSICRVYRVNYYWLKDGVGDMFIGTPQTVVEEIAEEYDLDDIDKKILEKYLELPKEKREVIKEYFKSIFIEEKTED